MNNTQTELEKPSYKGRPIGSLSKKTIQKRAMKVLEKAVLDDTLPDELRTQAALRLTEAQ